MDINNTYVTPFSQLQSQDVPNKPGRSTYFLGPSDRSFRSRVRENSRLTHLSGTAGVELKANVGLISGNNTSNVTFEDLFENYDSLAYDDPMYTTNSIPMSWGVARNTSLFISPEPTYNSCTPEEAVNNADQFFDELVLHQVKTVVDLRSRDDIASKEPNSSFFNRYYPDQVGEVISYPDWNISLVKSHNILEDITSYQFELVPSTHQGRNSLSSNQSSQPYCFEVLHYTGWKDGCAITPHELIRMGNLVINLTSCENNALVHCVGGAGRTGTLVTFMQLKLQLLNMSKQSAVRAQPEVREQFVMNQIEANRVAKGGSFVETPAQYELIIDALYFDSTL